MPQAKEISPVLRTWTARRKLRALYVDAKARGDLGEWRRCKGVLDFLGGKSVAVIAEELDTVRSCVYEWLNRLLWPDEN